MSLFLGALSGAKAFSTASDSINNRVIARTIIIVSYPNLVYYLLHKDTVYKKLHTVNKFLKLIRKHVCNNRKKN